MRTNLLFVIACVLCLIACSTNAVKNAAAINGAAITTVDQGMNYWAAYSQTHPVTSNQINTVSNAYTVYYNLELISSNVQAGYVANPTTNTEALASEALIGVVSSRSNLLNLVTMFTK